jgi:hypothetical protein
MLEKLKSLILNDHIFFGLLVLLVGVGSFALGRVSVQQPVLPETSVRISEQQGSANAAVNPLEAAKKEDASSFGGNITLVASKSGTKYHLESCPGSKQIKETNKIFFSSREAAEAAGYKPAANCPGLQ